MKTQTETAAPAEPQAAPSEAAPAGRAVAVTEPPRKSPYSVRARIGRLAWGATSFLLWSNTPRAASGIRVALLRLFGAKVGRGVQLDPSVKVEIPWNLTIGDNVRVCRRAILYCLGPITIGDGTLIGPHAHLCAGTHDFTDPRFTLLRQPITIGRGCVIQTAAFVAPSTTVGDGAVLEPRACLYSDAEEGAIYEGNPARAVGRVEERRA